MNIENKRMILGVANAWNDKKGFNDLNCIFSLSKTMIPALRDASTTLSMPI